MKQSYFIFAKLKLLMVSVSAAFILSGCFADDIAKRKTLADLALAPVEYEKADSIAPEKFKAVENYQDYLEKLNSKRIMQKP